MIELISGIISIVFVITIIGYIKVNKTLWKETVGYMQQQLDINKTLSNEIQQLKATIKKDREAIADYLNELTIKKKDNE